MSSAYVYRLTDKQTGKRYIGARYAKGCNPSELGRTYFTSSGVVEPLFKADPERFSVQIIVTGDRDYVIKVEKTLIDFSNAVLSGEFYNRTNNRAIHPDDVMKGRAKVTFEQLSKAGKIGGSVSGPWNAKRLPLFASKAGKIGGVATCRPRFRCLACGMETNRGNMARHKTAKRHLEWEPV